MTSDAPDDTRPRDPDEDHNRARALFCDERELHRRMAPHLPWSEFQAALKALQAEGFPPKAERWLGWYWPGVVAWFDDFEGLTERTADPVAEAVVEAYFAPGGFVYFALASSRIKIGFTRNWQDRLRTMRTSCPEEMDFIAVIKGDRTREREFHERFSHLRTRGEWFEATAELLAFIAELRKSGAAVR